MIQNLIFGTIYLKILLRACNTFIFFHTFQWTSFPDRLAESLKANKNQQKRSLISQYSFAQKTSLILRTSTHLTLKIICSRNTVKNFSDFTNFPANMFLFGVRKNIWTASFLDVKELHSCSTLKANVCRFLYISVKKYLSQRQLAVWQLTSPLLFPKLH